MRRLIFIVGLGIGFVLGARAGRERYEQLRKLARKAAENPAVQEAAGAIQAQAVSLAKLVGDKLADRATVARARFGEALHDRLPGLRDRDSDGRASGHTREGSAQAPPTAG